MEAVADIPDGASIMIGAFSGTVGAPTQLVQALIDRGVRELTIIANGAPGLVREGPPALPRAEQLRKAICSFPVSNSTRGGPNPFEERLNKGEVELEMVPQGTLAERMRAAGAGIPAFFTPTGVGTEMAAGKEEREFEGRRYMMERWLKADYALVKARKGDRLGNLVYRGTARNFNPLMAMAANVTIAEIDELYEPGELEPERIDTPGIFVDRLFVAGER